MRFYVPNMEEQDDSEDKPMKADGAGKAEEEKKGEGDAEGEEENSEEEITPAKLFNDQILSCAGLGDTAGDVIASIDDLPLLVPRGKYTLNMFENYAKFHGKTHDYKLLYKDISRMFQLPRVDREQVVVLFQLSKPLNQGLTMHHFIMI